MPNAGNLIGRRFGKLTVLGRAENDKWGKSRWLCKCDCGGEKTVKAQELNRGDTTSCGCNYYISNKAFDLTGQQFDRLSVIRRSLESEKDVRWLCKCSCGKLATVRAASLMCGKTKSCGCLRREVVKCRATTHDGSFEPLYGVWNSLRQRSNNPKNKDYKFYGARGIKVCPEWIQYQNFRDWARASGYCCGLTIDRRDNDGNYEPNNCHWISLQAQMKNRRPKRRIPQPET